MQALAYWQTLTADHSDFLHRILALLSDEKIRYCVIGGQAVNAYVEPVVSLDLHLAVAMDDIARAEAQLRDHFRVERFPHSVNISAADSDLRVQLQTDERYAPFVDRAAAANVLGLSLPVAALEDVLRGKVWAALDPSRRPSKRQKDLADISRILEARPGLRTRVPQGILDRLV